MYKFHKKKKKTCVNCIKNEKIIKKAEKKFIINNEIKDR